MPRNHAAPITVLMVASAIAVTWWVGKSSAPTNAVLDHGRPADNGPIDMSTQELEDTVEFADDNSPGGAVEQPGIGNLVITLVDVAQFPLIDEQVSIYRIGGTQGESNGLTNHQGDLTFEGLVEGRYRYIVSATGQPKLIALAPVYVTSGETTAVTVMVRNHNYTIGGIVLDRNGAPVTGMAVTARAHHIEPAMSANLLQRHSSALAQTGDDGQFQIMGLQLGEYEISTEEDERYISTNAIVRAGVDSAVLTVGEHLMRWIVGTVINDRGEPLAGVNVMPPPGSSETVLTDLQGRYVLILSETNAVGRRYLRFLQEGYQETRTALNQSLFDSSEPLTIDARLTSLGATLTVTGLITDEYGGAVAGERVHLHSLLRYTTYRAQSGLNGEFTMEAVAASDDYRMWVRPQGPYGDYLRTSIALTSGQPHFDIVLLDLVTGTVYGRVLDGQYNPVPEFNFWLRSTSAKGRALPVMADSEGSFTVEDVPAGRLTLGTRSQPRVRITGIELTAEDVKYIEIMLE